jgi:hypothetical protein
MLPIETKSRPRLLTWLCIGSGVFGSLWISMLLSLMLFSLTGNVPGRLFPGLTLEYLQAGYLFLIAEILLTGIGVTGVILMWQMKKTGFYLYATIKTILYFLPVLAIGTNHLTFPALLSTSVLIIMYGVLFTGKPNSKLND